MIATSSKGVPIFPGFLAQISSRPRNVRFGAKPFSGYGCSCGPVGGCGCGPSGLGAFGQSASLDQVISNATAWLTGVAESNLPASAAVPSNIGSLGSLSATITQYLPYIIGGVLVYMLVSKK